MHRTLLGLSIIAITLAACDAQDAAKSTKLTPKEALQPFNELIGPWRANGEPEGVSAADRQKGFWKETVSWSWKFSKGDDCWITFAIGKGKYFKNGEIRYLPDKDKYQLTATTIDNKTQVFEGQFNESKRSIAFEREDEAKKETQKLTIDFVEDIRFVYRYEYKPEGRKQFVKAYKVGATKEGESIAAGGGGKKGPVCVVSGGLGTMQVSYKGMTYYVCCSGCRDAFNDNPEKFIKEYEAKKAKGEIK
jgi:YHS domain-containing protein